MTKIKAIRIDSANRRFHEVELDQSDTDAICGFVGCSMFDVVRVENRDVIFVDDEGLLTANEDTHFFTVGKYDGILVGNGLVVGTDDEGESVDAETTIEWLENNISFGKMVKHNEELIPVLL